MKGTRSEARVHSGLPPFEAANISTRGPEAAPPFCQPVPSCGTSGSLGLGVCAWRVALLLIGPVRSSLLAGRLGGPIVAVARVSCWVAQRRCRAPLWIGTKVGAPLWVAPTGPVAVRHPVALRVALTILRISSRGRCRGRIHPRRGSAAGSCTGRRSPGEARRAGCLVRGGGVATLGGHLVARVGAARVRSGGRGRLRWWPLLRRRLRGPHLGGVGSVGAAGRPTAGLVLLGTEGGTLLTMSRVLSVVLGRAS